MSFRNIHWQNRETNTFPRRSRKNSILPRNKNNPRYPQDKKYYQNYIDLEVHASSSEEMKVRHIESMLKRRREVSSSNTPSHIELMYLLRLKAIICAYFPDEDRYGEFRGDFSEHHGWSVFDECSRLEKDILDGFRDISDRISFDRTAVSEFLKVDMNFGVYRHQRWKRSIRPN